MVSHFLTIVPMWDTIMVCRAVVWERKSSVVPVSWRKKTELERVSRGVSESDELSSFRKQDKKYFFYRCLLVGISVRPGRMSQLYPCFLFLKTLGRFHFFLPSPLFHGIQSRLISGGGNLVPHWLQKFAKPPISFLHFGQQMDISFPLKDQNLVSPTALFYAQIGFVV